MIFNDKLCVLDIKLNLVSAIASECRKVTGQECKWNADPTTIINAGFACTSTTKSRIVRRRYPVTVAIVVVVFVTCCGVGAGRRRREAGNINQKGCWHKKNYDGADSFG